MESRVTESVRSLPSCVAKRSLTNILAYLVQGYARQVAGLIMRICTRECCIIATSSMPRRYGNKAQDKLKMLWIGRTTPTYCMQ